VRSQVVVQGVAGGFIFGMITLIIIHAIFTN
jgi:hypothetical protein